jgi:hypothetical protein
MYSSKRTVMRSSVPLSDEIDVLAMDGAYYRQETVNAAECKNIELNFYKITGRKAKLDQIPVTQFEIYNEHHHVLSSMTQRSRYTR